MDSQTLHRFIAARQGVGDGCTTSLLASAGSGLDAQERPTSLISPSYKARLDLLALGLAEPNFHLLDEPTNHGDMPEQKWRGPPEQAPDPTYRSC